MKKNRMYIKSLLCASALLAGSVGLSTAWAQQPGSMPAQQPGIPSPAQGAQQTSPSGMGPASENSGPSMQAMDDRTFVKEALEGGEAEVQLGQLAQQKSQSDDVKQFAQKMVTDHTQMGQDMMAVAKNLGVSAPNSLSKKDKQFMAKLAGLSGAQFDQEYIKAMVKDHKDDLKAFKDEAQMAQDSGVKQEAQKGQQVIQEHLQMIEQIAQSHNVSAGQKETSSLQ